MTGCTPKDATDLPDNLIAFDGDCGFCSRSVHWVAARDASAVFKYCAMQGEAGRALAARYDVDPDDPVTNIVIANGTAYFKSDAVFAVLAQLPRWRWARVLRLIPRATRDYVYDRVARNRFVLFGPRDACALLTPDLAARFITELPAPTP